jgi:amidohydrolase
MAPAPNGSSVPGSLSDNLTKAGSCEPAFFVLAESLPGNSACRPAGHCRFFCILRYNIKKSFCFMTGKLPEQTLKKIISLRKTLHKNPEVSGKEKQTAKRLKTFLEKLKPDKLYTGLAGHGLLAVFDSGKEGPALLLRADIDALPIQEVNDFEHRSTNDGVAHKCGHDGHSAIMAGVATLLSDQRPKKGKVLLLFQPEEETGQGAEKILKEKVFETHVPDMAFALHNLPGYRKKAVVLRQGPFAAASKGMIIDLKGRSSHAAHPEQGNSPVKMMCSLMGQLMEYSGAR